MWVSEITAYLKVGKSSWLSTMIIGCLSVHKSNWVHSLNVRVRNGLICKTHTKLRTMDPSEFWAMLEAVGTILAVCVALFFGLREDIRRLRSRPKISVDYRDEFKTIEENSCRMPLKISNEGRTAAFNVRLKILEVIQNGVNFVAHSSRMFLFDVDSLPSGDFSVQNFLMFSKATRAQTEGKEMRVYTFSGRETPGYTGQYISKADTMFKLIVSGDNIVSQQLTFEFRDSDDYLEMTLVKIE